MPRNTKRMESAVCEPHCIKEADLGRLDARIANTEQTEVEIKEALQRLVDNHAKDKQESNVQFTTITAEIAKMSSAMQSSAESSKQLLENQNKLLGELNKLLLANQDIANKQNSLDSTLATQMDIAEKRYEKTKAALEDAKKRLTKLEQHRNTVVSIGALIISLLTAAGLVAQILQAFNK